MFCLGRPKIFTDDSFQEAFTSLCFNSTGSLLAAVSPTCITVWSSEQHLVLLAQLCRTLDDVALEGSNIRVIWKHDSSTLAVETTRGCIHFYNVHVLDEHLYPSAAELTDITTVVTNPRCATLSVRSRAELLRDHVKCVIADQDYVTLGTNDGYLVRLHWSGELADSVSLAQIMIDEDAVTAITRVVHMAKSASLGLYTLVYESGQVCLLSYPEDRVDDTFGSLQGKLLPSIEGEQAICCSFGDRLHLLAVGTDKGRVYLFNVGTMSLVATLNPPIADVSGAVQCIEWATDCATVAVGWKRRGMAVYSAHGPLLMTTCMKSFERPETVEPLDGGVTSLAWGQQSYQLLVASVRSADITEFNFVKAVRTFGSSQDDYTSCVLLGSDRVMLPVTGSWSQLSVPPKYLLSNWPLAYVAVSEGNRFVAVAGKRGAAIYDGMAQRWKVFGDITQEQQIECVGLQWVGRALLIACHIVGTDEYRLLFYPFHHLDRTSLMLSLRLVARPLLVDAYQHYVAVYLSTGVLMTIRLRLKGEISVNGRAQFTVQRVHQLKLLLPSIVSSSFFPPCHPFSVRILLCVDPTMVDLLTKAATTNAEQVLCVLVRTVDRRLSLVDVVTGDHVEIAANGVDCCWLTPGALSPFMRNTFWTFGDEGLRVWYIGGSSEPQITSADARLKLDEDVCVLGLSASLSAMVGVSRGLSSRLPGFPHFDIRLKTHPYLPYVLTHLLISGRDNVAIMAARAVDRQRNFAHSLEMFLHASLEDDWLASAEAAHAEGEAPSLPSLLNIPPDRRRLVSSARLLVLQRVVNILRMFPEYVEVIISCTRKTDFELWDVLFAVAGDPQQLMEQAAAAGALRAAASCVLPLQHTQGPPVAARAVFHLLDAALTYDDVELAGELVRYLRPWLDAAARKEILPSDLHAADTHEDKQPLTMEELPFFVDMVLSSYAKTTLNEYRIVQLARFAQSTEFDLRGWLVKERDGAAEVRNMREALENVCAEYGIRMPSSKTALAELKKLSAETSQPLGNGGSADSSQSNTSPSSRRASRTSSVTVQSAPVSAPSTPAIVGEAPILPDAVHELGALLQDFLAADCVEWSLVICAALRRYSTALTLLRAYTEPAVHAAFASMFASEDEELHQELTALLAADAEAQASRPDSQVNDLSMFIPDGDVTVTVFGKQLVVPASLIAMLGSGAVGQVSPRSAAAAAAIGAIAQSHASSQPGSQLPSPQAAAKHLSPRQPTTAPEPLPVVTGLLAPSRYPAPTSQAPFPAMQRRPSTATLPLLPAESLQGRFPILQPPLFASAHSMQSSMHPTTFPPQQRSPRMMSAPITAANSPPASERGRTSSFVSQRQRTGTTVSFSDNEIIADEPKSPPKNILAIGPATPEISRTRSSTDDTTSPSSNISTQQSPPKPLPSAPDFSVTVTHPTPPAALDRPAAVGTAPSSPQDDQQPQPKKSWWSFW